MDRILISRQQIIYLYPFPNISSPDEQARWNQTNSLAIHAVQQLVDDYRAINQIEAGIAYFHKYKRGTSTLRLPRQPLLRKRN